MPYYHRKSIRLKDYDYRQSGAYFVTILTYQRMNTLADIHNERVILTSFGELAHTAWEQIPLHFPQAKLDFFVIMPNHVHGIIVITDRNLPDKTVSSGMGVNLPDKTVSSGMGANLPDKTVSSGMGANLPDKTVSGVRAQHVAPLHQPHHTDLYQPKGGVTPNNVISGSLGAIIRSFKGTVTRLAHQKDDYQTPIWHRNYHEHVIRDEKSLNFIREYILYNPAKWEQDSLYQK